MRLRRELASICLSGLLTLSAFLPLTATAQPSGPVADLTTVPHAAIPVAVEWTPAEFTSLGDLAEVKNSFVLDRTMLGAAAALLPDSENATRQSIRKLDGFSVRFYRFHDEIDVDPVLVDQVRQAYHARGWKHLVTTTQKGGPLHTQKTDLWLALDGVNVRGGTLLLVTPKSVSLVTFAGNLSPIDMLHLRGHFGIPGFSGEKFEEAR